MRKERRFAGGLAVDRFPVVAPSTADLYTLFSSEFVGSWWYLKGDGTMQAGSAVTMSGVNSPTANTVPVFSGLDGTDYTSRWLGGGLAAVGSYFTSGNTQGPTGSFSVGILFTGEKPADNSCLVGHNGATNAGPFEVQYNSGEGVSFKVFKAAGSSTSITSPLGDFRPRALHLAIMTYEFVADGTSKMRIYGNSGTPGASSDTAVGPPTNSASSFFGVGNDGWFAHAGVPVFTGNVMAAFYTQKALTAATITSMMASALDGQPVNSKGVAATVTRNSIGTVVRPDGRVMVARVNRPRLARGGVLVEDWATNFAKQTDTFVGNGWSAETNVVLTQADSFAPDGSKTGVRFTEDTGTSEHRRFLVVGGAGTTSQSVFARAGTRTWAHIRGTGGAGVWYDVANGVVGTQQGGSVGTIGPPDALGWRRLTWYNAAGNGGNIVINMAPSDGVISYTGTSSYMWFWRAQVEAGPAATSPILTITGAVLRQGDLITTSTTGWPVGSGKMTFNYVHPWNGNPPDERYLTINYDAGFKGVSIRILSTGVVRVNTENSTTDTSALTWVQGQTYTIEIRWGSGNVTISRDGVVVGSGSGKKMPPSLASTQTIGGNFMNINQNCNGFISDFRVSRLF